MVPAALRTALFLTAALLPTRVLGDDRGDDNVSFQFTVCALACIEATGYNTYSEDEQKDLCVAARQGLLEIVEQCMLLTCSDGLPDVDQDLLTPMQTGCEIIEKPVSDQDIEEAEAAASSFVMSASPSPPEAQGPATPGPTTTTAQETSTLIPYTSGSAQSTVQVDTGTQVPTATSVAPSSPSAESTTATVLPAELAPTSVEQSTSSAGITTEVTVPTDLIPATTSTAIQSSATSLTVGQTATISLQSTPQTSVSEPTSGRTEATSTSATNSAIKGLLSSTIILHEVATNSATSASFSRNGETSTVPSTTASSTDDDSLVMETGTPTTYTGTLFGFATSTTTSSVSSPSSSSDSSTTQDGIGGGSPFSTSNAAFKEHAYGLATLFAVIAMLLLVM